MDPSTFESLALALGLGFVVGLQRQWHHHRLAGIRTFPLITLLGASCAMLAGRYGQGVLVAGVLALASVLAIGNFVALRRSADIGIGVTTEIAALLMFAVGAIVVDGQFATAIVIAGVAGVLLQWKSPLHALVSRFGEEDLRAIFQFVVIALVILPVLPDEQMGPFAALNPFRIWVIVALIVGLSLAAYFVYRFVGVSAGVLLGGVLGGLVSSTATTVSCARQSTRISIEPVVFATVIVLASAVVYLRIAAELGVMAPELLEAALVPLAIMFSFSMLCGLGLFLKARHADFQPPELENPANVRFAVIFGGLYALILIAVAALDQSLGGGTAFAVAIVSGLTDVDALTLSMADLSTRQLVETSTAWRAVIVASLSNLAVKGVVVAIIGARAILLPVVLVFGAIFAVGVAIVVLWP